MPQPYDPVDGEKSLTFHTTCVTILWMSLIRVFVAIQSEEKLRSALLDVQGTLRQAADERHLGAIVRWVNPENIHLTIKFLGEVQVDRIPELEDALLRSSIGIAPFTLSVRGLGCFPNSHSPSVIWAGMGGQLDLLVNFARQVETVFGAIGFAVERRPFSPHLTLGRIKRGARPSERAAVGELIERLPTKEIGVIDARALSLVKSDLRPEGPLYSILATVEFHDFVPGPS